MTKRVFMMVVAANANLNGFVEVTAEQVAAELRSAGHFYKLHWEKEGPNASRELDQCLEAGVSQVREIITFFEEDKGTQPTENDVTIAMHWAHNGPQFYIAHGPLMYTPKPSLPPPPND